MGWEEESKMLSKTILAVKTAYRTVDHITTAKLAELLSSAEEAAKMRLFDVRELNEFNISHLKDAEHLSPDATLAQLSELLDRLANQGVRSMVFYCSVGYRSAKKAREIGKIIKKRSGGGTPIEMSLFNLEGSIFKWANEGKEMVNAVGQETKSVHPYNSFYALSLDKSYWKWS